MSTDPRFAYRETAARAASPLGRVVLLYEQAIHDLAGALSALNNGDIELRTQKTSHALLVIGQLQACLDLDRGGEVAHNLNRFYDLMRKGLLEAQVKSSAVILKEHIDLLLSVRSAWIELERQDARVASEAPKQPATEVGDTPTTAKPPSRWRA
jgi:flagellar protein FliS